MSMPPTAPKKPHTSTHHGSVKEDPYHWLRADNWQEVMQQPETLEAEIKAYLDAENTHTEGQLASTKDLQAKLFEELKGRIKQDDSTVPQKDGPWAYFVSYVKDGQHPLYCRQPSDDEAADKQTLLDGNALSKGKAYFQFGGISHSPDHKRLAWTADEKGSEYYTLYVRDLETGKDQAHTIEKTTGNVCWGQDANTLYYVKRDDNHRPAFVYRHQIGQDKEDELIYQEQDPGFFVNIGTTQSNQYVVINASGHETSEWHMLDAHDPKSQPQCVTPRQIGHEYDIEEREGTLYILTNYGGAEDFKIVTAPLGQSDPRPHPPQSRLPDLKPHPIGRLSHPHGTRRRLAPHCGPRFCHRPRTRHRL